MGRGRVALAGAGVATALGIGAYVVLAPESDAEFYRQAETIATAVSWPRRYSAAGYTRAVLATNAGSSGTVTVVESTELEGESIADPIARLVLRFHREPPRDTLFPQDAVTVCYELEFDYYGAMGDPDTVNCPGHKPITPPPIPVIGEPSFDQAVERTLMRLPESPTEDALVNRLTRADLYRPPPLVDDAVEIDPKEPVIDVQLTGADVAVSFYRTTTPICVLASRVNGKVEVWHPQDPRYHQRDACTAPAAITGEGR